MNSKDVISLGVGEPDFATPWSVREEAIYSLEKGTTAYTSNQGIEELRNKISAYLNSRFSVKYSHKHEVLVTVGASEAIDISLRTILNPGDEVIIFEPSFVSYSPLVKLAGGIPISLDTTTTDFLPDIKELKKLISKKTKAVIFCSPNNPTGAVIPRKLLIKIAELAEIFDFWVISDEIYAEICFDKTFVSFASLPSVKKRCILISGFSKAFSMTGWRLGYLCGPKPFIERALKIHQYSMMCASTQSQYAAIEALNDDVMIEIEKMVDSYEKRCRYFVSQ
jgi:Aspartate/tyrosine/aromatic aminotransferase